MRKRVSQPAKNFYRKYIVGSFDPDAPCFERTCIPALGAPKFSQTANRPTGCADAGALHHRGSTCAER
jgi:hypothetical protein